MITEVKKVIDKFVELSQNGYLTISYENKFVSIDFHATEEFELKVRDNDDTCRLFYIADDRAVPCELSFKTSEIKSAVYYEEGEFSKMPFGDVIVITFNDESEIHCFEDVR